MSSQRQFSIVIVEKAWLILSGLLTLKMLSSSLSVADFGVYQSAVAILVIATAVTWICPVEAIAARLDSCGRLSQPIFQTILALRIAISISIFVGIAGFSSLMYDGEYERYMLVLLVCVSILHVEPAGLLKFQIEAQGKLFALSAARLANNILRLIVMAILAHQGASAATMIALIALEQLANSIMYCVFFRSANPHLSLGSPSFDKQAAVDILQAGSKYWVGFVLMYCQLKFDRVYLASTMNEDSFGVYSAGANMAEQVNSLGLMLVGVLAPAYIYAKSKDEALVNAKSFALKIFVTGCVISAAAYVCAPIAFAIIFGHKYDAALQVFKVLVLLSPLAFLDAGLSVLIFKFDYRHVFIAKTVVAFAITAGVIALTSSSYGWIAAAVGSFGALLSNMIFNIFAIRKITEEYKCPKKLAS